MGSQVVQREKLNESELLTNFPRLIQAWAGPLGAIPHGPEGGNGSCYASLPLLCLCSYSVMQGLAAGPSGKGAGLWLQMWLCGCWWQSPQRMARVGLSDPAKPNILNFHRQPQS